MIATSRKAEEVGGKKRGGGGEGADEDEDEDCSRSDLSAGYWLRLFPPSLFISRAALQSIRFSV